MSLGTSTETEEVLSPTEAPSPLFRGFRDRVRRARRGPVLAIVWTLFVLGIVAGCVWVYRFVR